MVHKILATALLAAGLACQTGDDGADAGRSASISPSSETASTTDTRPVAVFLGTSLTAGLGVSESEAYPARIQHRLDSAGIGLRVVNAGLSGETSAGGLRRVDRLLEDPIRLFVLELGANDGLRGLGVEQMEDNLQAIIDRVRDAHPDARIVIAGMQAPPNLGQRYTTAFRETFTALAERNDAALIPFLLEGVGGVPSLNQSDGIHPTAEGHEVLADNVWEVLGPAAREVTR
jgi:acyl-CoA thioesterase-1